MNETTKTSIFLALALVLLGVAFLARPVVRELDPDKTVGKPLFPEFTDPLAVKRLEIVRFDASGDRQNFRVAEVDGVWSIPSHENYPSDAKDQMGRVTEALIDLNVLEVAAKNDDGTDATALHTMYGVIDPTSENASLGEGIGIKVTLEGSGDETLVDLIIGKAVDTEENASPDRPAEPGKMRYVRIAGQLPVYVVEIDANRFAANFDQWIEKNLLDISTYDVKEIYVDEYSLETSLEMTRQGPREVIAPTFIGDMTFGYDASKTGTEKWSLKKWMGFRGTQYEYYERKLAENRELNPETLDAMISALNDLKIVDVTKKPSVLAAALREDKPLEEIQADPSLKNAGFFLVPMPDLKNKTNKNRIHLLSNKGDIQLRMKDGTLYTLRFGDLTGTESEIEGEADSSVMGANRYLFITAQFDPSFVAPADIQELPQVPAEGDEETIKKARTERERIEKSNKREQERYDDAVKAGKERVQKLNERFADWYYVIPEDVYKKIHLTQENVFQDKTSEEKKDAPVHGEAGHVCGDDCDHAPATSVEGNTGSSELPGMGGLMKNPDLPTATTEPKTDYVGVVDWPEPVKSTDAKAEDVEPEGMKSEDAAPEPAKTEDTKPDSGETEPAKAEDIKPKEEPKSEEKPETENAPNTESKPEEKEADDSKTPENESEKKEDKENDPVVEQNPPA